MGGSERPIWDRHDRVGASASRTREEGWGGSFAPAAPLRGDGGAELDPAESPCARDNRKSRSRGERRRWIVLTRSRGRGRCTGPGTASGRLGLRWRRSGRRQTGRTGAPRQRGRAGAGCIHRSRPHGAAQGAGRWPQMGCGLPAHDCSLIAGILGYREDRGANGVRCKEHAAVKYLLKNRRHRIGSWKELLALGMGVGVHDSFARLVRSHQSPVQVVKLWLYGTVCH